MSATDLPRAHCLECGCVGPTVSLKAGDDAALAVALLPRCGCLFRLHNARPVQALANLLSSDTLPDAPASDCDMSELARGESGHGWTTAMQLSTREPAAEAGSDVAHRPVLSADVLKESLLDGTRELMVYGTAVCEEVSESSSAPSRRFVPPPIRCVCVLCMCVCL